MSIVANRGGSPLTDENELRAHLASLLRLENVGLLLGAGASTSAGGLTMKMLWNRFLTDFPNEARWLCTNGFLQAGHCPPEPDVAVGPGDALALHTHVPHPVAIPNIERLVDALEIALLDWKRTRDEGWTEGIAARTALFRTLVHASKLNEAWWTLSSAAALPDGLRDHRTVLQKLTAARQPGQSAPWVFTTNYDLAVEWAAESVDLHVVNGFLGLHARRFSPQSFDLGYRNVLARGEARFGVYNIYLAKLHGSLTWKEVEHELIEVPAAQAWPDIKEFIDGNTTDLTYRVLPRAAKYVETTGYVLGELLRRFSEFLSRPQTALLVSGYAFNDEHINRLLRSALLNPTLHVVAYLPEFDGNINGAAMNPAARRLLALNNPRLTVVGGASQAYFSALAAHLPEPTIYDEDLHELRRRLSRPDADECAQ
jgi:hypothetical protein